MIGPLFDRPGTWGKAWSLYRRQTATDSAGDPVAVYDMDAPSFQAEAGSTGAVAWQVQSGEASVDLPGEHQSGSATGRVYDPDLQITAFDRISFDGATWEVRSVECWPNHRKVTVMRV